MAIKTMLPRLQEDPDSADRFRREARMAARLRHPHIVRVHTVGEADGRLYIDMELVEGSSLADALEPGPLDPLRAADIVARVADALDEAHALTGAAELRMIHRDVKPGNVLLEPRPRGEHVYLADFGVARAVTPDVALAGTGVLVGTPAYMAPELWTGSRPDHRIDVYALAVTTFEMLVGHRPFSGDGVAPVMTAT